MPLVVCAVMLVTHEAAAQSASVRKPDGKELFSSYCAPCHGADARGNGPAASALKTQPADLTAITLRNKGMFPRERLIDFIVNGDASIPAHGSKEMPVWGPNFAALDPGSFRAITARVDAIVSYLRSIQREK